MRTRESWSRQWYDGLTHSQHDANDEWFVAQLNMLKDTGVLYVPNIGQQFNKQGKLISESIYGSNSN